MDFKGRNCSGEWWKWLEGRVLSLDGRIPTQWVVNEIACVV